MNYLDRLKQLESRNIFHNTPDMEPSKPSKAPFEPFEGTGTAHIEKIISVTPDLIPSEGAHFLWHVETKARGMLQVSTWPMSTLAEILRDFPEAVSASPLPDAKR